MRIMTSNIWGDFFDNPTHLRSDGLYTTYEKYSPDIIGFQEAAAGWYDATLFVKLSENYNFVGTSLFKNTNSTPIAIKKEYKILAYGHEQLENTPDISKAITWAVLEKDGKRFVVCNTHFWWMRGKESLITQQYCGVVGHTAEMHCELRNQNAAQLSALMKHLHEKYSCPVFAFGDMNAAVSEPLFEVFAQNGVKKLFDMTENRDLSCTVHGDPQKGDDGKFHGKKATPESMRAFRKELCLEDDCTDGYLTSIDHIISLGDGFSVSSYRVVEDAESLDASDHCPVYADVSLD